MFFFLGGGSEANPSKKKTPRKAIREGLRFSLARGHFQRKSHQIHPSSTKGAGVALLLSRRVF